MQIGDRVIHTRLTREYPDLWHVGIVEAIEPKLAPSGDQIVDVRWLTEDTDAPGCCVSMCWRSELQMQ